MIMQYFLHMIIALPGSLVAILVQAVLVVDMQFGILAETPPLAVLFHHRVAAHPFQTGQWWTTLADRLGLT